MTNVMGREFPYTPEGRAAAQQYSQAMGMRNPGPMGFRPLGYADGDAVNANRQIYSDFKTALTELPENKLAEYIYNNLSNLKSMSEANPAAAAQLADAMEKSGFEGYMRNLIQGAGQVPEEQGGNLGRMGTSPQGMSDFMRLQGQGGNFTPTGAILDEVPVMAPTGGRLSDRDVENLMRPQGQVPPPEGQVPPSWGENLTQIPGPQGLLMDPLNPGIDSIEELPNPPWMSDPRFKGYYNPDQLNPFFNPNEIGVANGGYITRNMNRGGLMSLRRR